MSNYPEPGYQETIGDETYELMAIEGNRFLWEIRNNVSAMTIPVAAYEAVNTRSLNNSTDPFQKSAVHNWIVQGTEDDLQAWNLVFANSPTIYDGIPRYNIAQAEFERPVYRSAVTYSFRRPKDESVLTWDFDIGLENVHIDKGASFKGYTKTQQTPGPTDLPDFKGYINVRTGAEGTEVMGVDDAQAAVTFRVTKLWQISSLPGGGTFAGYAKLLAGIVGRVNSDSFAGFDAGELKLIGVQGNERAREYAQLTYTFAVRENQTTVDLGGGLVVDQIDGWEYVWLHYEEEVDTTATKEIVAPDPRAAYLHKLQFYEDFSQLGLGL